MRLNAQGDVDEKAEKGRMIPITRNISTFFQTSPLSVREEFETHMGSGSIHIAFELVAKTSS